MTEYGAIGMGAWPVEGCHRSVRKRPLDSSRGFKESLLSKITGPARFRGLSPRYSFIPDIGLVGTVPPRGSSGTKEDDWRTLSDE